MPIFKWNIIFNIEVMRPVFKLLQFLRLCLIGMGMFFVLVYLFRHSTCYFYPMLDIATLIACQHILMRIVICLIAIIYLYLYENKRIKGLFKPIGHCTMLICPISLQCLMTLVIVFWNSIKATLWSIEFAALCPLEKITYFNGFQVVFLAALGEELLFRAVLQRLLEQLTESTFFAMVVSALAFSFFHICPRYFDTYFIMGCFFSLLYNKTNHIIYPIMAHAVHNLLVILVVYFNTVKAWVLHLSLCTRVGLMMGMLVCVYILLTQVIERPLMGGNQ